MFKSDFERDFECRYPEEARRIDNLAYRMRYVAVAAIAAMLAYVFVIAIQALETAPWLGANSRLPEVICALVFMITCLVPSMIREFSTQKAEAKTVKWWSGFGLELAYLGLFFGYAIWVQPNFTGSFSGYIEDQIWWTAMFIFAVFILRPSRVVEWLKRARRHGINAVQDRKKTGP